MLFNSAEFLLFFPLVVALYFVTPQRWRWVLLLAASYYFYAAWRLEYILLIWFSTLVDYYCGLKIGEGKHAKRFLAISLTSNLGLLFLFKYFNLFNETTRALFDQFNLFYGVPAFQALLPVGISFYTFQTMSYTIDVYRGKRKPERHLGIFALYVAFFPQLVAGPIERSTRLLPQFYATHHFEYRRVESGLRLMAWGFFKKLVIADKLAIFVNAVYDEPQQYGGFVLMLATYFFAYQIYCDFSGYSDIAIGAARVMGFDLIDNFRQPYLSRSIGEFWGRWHISLSTWFRDYLYIPLGGSRVSTLRWAVNIMIVFLVSGLWHGANWTFMVWGGLHGVYLLIEQGLGRIFGRIPNYLAWLQIAVTFHLVLFAWIFFRADSLDQALYIVTHLFSPATIERGGGGFGVGFGMIPFVITMLAIVFMEGIDFLRRRPWTLSLQNNLVIRWGFSYALIVAILLFGELQSRSQFVYFQF